jgi:hypothetical protein
MREKRRVQVQYLALPCHSLPAKFGQHEETHTTCLRAQCPQRAPAGPKRDKSMTEAPQRTTKMPMNEQETNLVRTPSEYKHRP